MPPKCKIQKDSILEKAFDLVRKDGFEKVTARKLAGELGCSTQPIYQAFTDMNGVKAEVTAKAQKLLFQSVLSVEEDDLPQAVSIILAYIRFADREPHLFRLLFTNGSTMLSGVVRTEASMDRMPALDMIVYANGIIMMQAFGTLLCSEEEVKRMVSEAYEKLQDKRQQK